MDVTAKLEKLELAEALALQALGVLSALWTGAADGEIRNPRLAEGVSLLDRGRKKISKVIADLEKQRKKESR